MALKGRTIFDLSWKRIRKGLKASNFPESSGPGSAPQRPLGARPRTGSKALQTNCCPCQLSRFRRTVVWWEHRWNENQNWNWAVESRTRIFDETAKMGVAISRKRKTPKFEKILFSVVTKSFYYSHFFKFFEFHFWPKIARVTLVVFAPQLNVVRLLRRHWKSAINWPTRFCRRRLRSTSTLIVNCLKRQL